LDGKEDMPDTITPLPVDIISGSVAVSNLPSSQVVSGTVAVSNLPSSQVVSGTVAVSNLPSSQVVSGTVAVSGTTLIKETFSTAPVSGQQAITASGAPLPISNVTHGCWLSSPTANSQPMYIGNQYLVGNKGILLSVGQNIWIPVNNMSLLYVQSASGTQLLNYLAV
jgi:hypothetical protein